MAVLHTNNTQLEPTEPTLSLNLSRPFILSLAVLFLIAMHFFMPNPGGYGLELSFNDVVWLVLSFTIAISLYQVANNRRLRYSKLTIGLLVSVLLMTIPFFYHSADQSESSIRILGLWSGLFFLVALQQFKFTNHQKQRLLWLIVLATIIESLLGYYQYFMLEPNNILGYNTVANRPYGIFQQPNVMATFLATGLVISSYLLSLFPKKYQRQSLKTLLLYFIPLLTIPLLIILASRTGWLGASLSLLFIAPRLYKTLNKRQFMLWCGSLVSGLILGFTILQIGGTSDFVLSKADLESPRRYTFPQALDMIIEKPLSGYGYGRFEPEYMLYTARQHQLNENYPAGLSALAHPHNELLYWGAEGGIVPLIGIIIAATLVLFKIYSAKKHTRLAMLALFIPILLHTQLEYPFYHSAVHWLIFIILIFWVDQRTATYKQLSFSSAVKTLMSITTLLIPILTSFYMITVLHTNYVLAQFERSPTKDVAILDDITYLFIWKDRYDWDIYRTYLHLGLATQNKEYIQQYINWSLSIIKTKPRTAYYSYLILAYQESGEDSRVEQVKKEAQFLFPDHDFSKIRYNPSSGIQTQLSKALSTTDSMIE